MTARSFFERVDRVLRRSLGVSETAKADATVKPAPEVVEPEEVEEKKKTESAKEKVADLDEDVNLADVDIDSEKMLKSKPFDTSKAIQVDVDGSGSGHKVGIVPPEDGKWGAGSWEDNLEGENFIDIKDFLKMANADEEKEKTAEPVHDEL